MLKITVTGNKTNDPLLELINDVKKDDELIKMNVNALAQDTAFKMKEIITENKVRPQAGDPTDLENAISVDYFENGWGVGDIEILNKSLGKNAWAAINWGSFHLIGKHLPPGEFVPGKAEPSKENFRQGRWKRPGAYSPIVTKPIPAMNYIEKTIFWLSEKFNALKGF
jgi:hypothetical protein